jgi:flagellin-like hook-associated protein FlgL
VDKVFVAKRVATKLRGAEHSIDAALVEASEMVAELLRARKELGLAANVGDAALAKITAAVTALSEARTSMVAAHSELAEVQLRLGIRTRMDGGENKVEDAPQVSALKEVA